MKARNNCRKTAKLLLATLLISCAVFGRDTGMGRLECAARGLGFSGRIVSVVETNGVCDIVYEYETGSNGLVRCELALPPADKWNGWFKGVGNVGAAGSLKADWVLGPAARGIAAAMTDMGSSDGRCTLNPVAIRDFGHRATHLMTVGAKQLVEAYYGRKPSYSFFEGISSGGGQGIHEAQRYPADYDGIIAGVPANRRLAIAAYFRHVYRLTHDESGKLLFSPEQAAALSDAGVEYFKGGDEPYCDGRFLSEPRYTPEAASGIVELAARKCPSLAEPELRKRAEALFADVVVDGRRVCGGLPFGAKLQAILGRDTFVMKWHFGGKWDIMRTSDSEFAAACGQLAPDLNADSTDLSAFAARGGKIIMYSGIEDPIIPWSHITEYYESVVKGSGGFDEVRKFFAYYPMPGRSHTPDNWRNYGGRGIWWLDGLEKSLHDWVANSVFPGTLQGRHADRVTTAPVPPYPLKTAGSAAVGWSVGRYAPLERPCDVARDSWHGFDRRVFEFLGCEAWIVEPKAEAEGRPWAWIMEWPDAFARRTGSVALLKAGYHVVTFRPGHYKNGKFVSQPGNMNNRRLCESREFQKYLVDELHFAPKANLIGMSWGGFYSVRYAGTYPDAVARIYLDAPLLDFSTLAGRNNWSLKAKYGVDVATYVGKDDPRQPVNMYGPIARAGIPILLIYGGADTTVAPPENCIRFADAFKAAGGDIEIVARGLYGHHPHGLEIDEQQKFVDFFNRK